MVGLKHLRGRFHPVSSDRAKVAMDHPSMSNLSSSDAYVIPTYKSMRRCNTNYILTTHIVVLYEPELDVTAPGM